MWRKTLSHAPYRPNWFGVAQEIADGGANYSVPAMPAIIHERPQFPKADIASRHCRCDPSRQSRSLGALLDHRVGE
jgi:hypothetical protein